MEEKEKDLEQEVQQEQPQEEEFDLEDILREFAPEEEETVIPDQDVRLFEAGEEETALPPEPEEEEDVRIYTGTAAQDTPALEEAAEEATGDTIRLEIPVKEAEEEPEEEELSGDTQRLPDLSDGEEVSAQEAPARNQRPLPEKAEPFSEDWEPEYEQPIGDYVPAPPILFNPRSRLRELKRKLVAGPEKRYYELNEMGLGKLQLAIFLSLVVVVLSAGVTVMYEAGILAQSRIKLMVFSQFISMLISAALGSYQLLEGLADLAKKRFTLNTMLVFTLIACVADGIFCLNEQRVPCCAAFSLQVTMSLWGAYQRRSTEMAQMDTLRKAVRLGSVSPVPEYHDGSDGLLRGEGEVEHFMDHYDTPSTPEKLLSWYALVALAMAVVLGVAAGVLHASVSFGVQVLAVSLLAAVPVTSFITLSRPMAVLEKRLHKVGAVICGWQGVRAMSRRVLFPVGHADLFPEGTCKMNGVKYYGDRDPDQVVAYCAALISADGGGLVPLFEQLLRSRSGRHYTARNLRAYGTGGIGGEVLGESVLMGSLPFLREMGVEVPEGISINQAVYAAIDGELCGVFAVTYEKAKDSAAGIGALCAYRGLSPVLLSGDFMLTESFLRSRFSVNTRRFTLPEREIRQQLQGKQIPEGTVSAALVTTGGLMPYAFAVTGARSVRTASIMGVAVHMLGGILGLAMMLLLAIMGEAQLLTPANMFLYELVWIIPGLLITEWTRTV